MAAKPTSSIMMTISKDETSKDVVPNKNEEKKEDFEKYIQSFIGLTVSGIKFNSMIGDEPMIKLTINGENHNGFQYKTGLNVDTREFYNKGSCTQGGIYFTSLYHFHTWVKYSSKSCVQYRYVTVPDDAKVYIEEMKFKADKIELGEPQLFNTLEKYLLDDKYTKSIKIGRHYSKSNIEYVMKEFQMSQDYYVKYIGLSQTSFSVIPETYKKDKNFRMKLYDINPDNIRNFLGYRDTTELKNYLEVKPEYYCDRYLTLEELANPDIYKFCFDKNPTLISNISIQFQTERMCDYVFEKDPSTFKLLAYKKDEMFPHAVEADGMNLMYIPVKKQNDKIIMSAVKQTGTALQFAAFQTFEIANTAVTQSGEAFQYVENQRPLTIVKNYDGTVTHEYDETLIETAIETFPEAVLSMKTFNERILTMAIDKKYQIIKSIGSNWITDAMKNVVFNKSLRFGFETFPKHNVSASIISNAIRTNIDNIKYIPSDFVFEQDMAEYIYNEHPIYRDCVINSMPRSHFEEVIKDDPLEAMFADTGFDVLSEILG